MNSQSTFSSPSNKSAITYVIADLHLAANRPDITACFISFLRNDAPKAEKLYILGDLFEYWIGDDDDSDFIQTIASAISALSTQNCHVFFIHGNRDFLLGNRFAKQCKMTLLPEVKIIDLYGRKTVIMHGDTLCTGDVDYQKFRKKSRSWWWQTLIKSLPLFIRKKIAHNYRLQSAQATAMKSQDIMDVTETEVINCLTEHDSQLLIHGHTHRPNIHHIQANNQAAQRIVVGDWYEQGSLLKITPNNIALLNKAFLI